MGNTITAKMMPFSKKQIPVYLALAIGFLRNSVKKSGNIRNTQKQNAPNTVSPMNIAK